MDAMSSAANPIVESGRALAKALRDEREFGLLTAIADVLAKGGYEDRTIIRLYAQGLSDSGQAEKAVPVLTALADKLPRDAYEFSEAIGLIGRAWKQIFFDFQDQSSPPARKALAQAFANYRFVYNAPPGGNTWLGLNVLALAAYARRASIALEPGVHQRTPTLPPPPHPHPLPPPN